MIVHPELRALRGDDSPQRHAQERCLEALADWRTIPQVMDVMADLSAFASGRPLSACGALARLFTPDDAAADEFVGSFMRTQIGALAAAPLGHPALRHFTDGVLSTLQLGRAGMVTLTLAAVDGQALASRPMPASVTFAPVETWQRVLAGSARADLVERRPSWSRDDSPDRPMLNLSPGQVHHRLGLERELLLREVHGRLVTLRLQRRDPAAGPAVEIDLATGHQLHQSAGSSADSRRELMVSLLGRMQRAEAAPTIAEVALGAGGEGMRWQALRECLSLDTAIGFNALQVLAGRTEDPLHRPAGELLGTLLAAYPQLKDLAACPA